MKEIRPRSPILRVTTSGVRTVLYTCPANCRSKVPLLYVVNVSGNTTITVELYKANVATHFYIVAGKNFTAGESLQLSDSYLVLEEGDKLEVTGTGGSVNVDAICTVEESFVPNGVA